MTPTQVLIHQHFDSVPSKSTLHIIPLLTRFTKLCHADVDQHVGIGTLLHRRVIFVAAKVVVDSFLDRAARYNVIVKLTPLSQRNTQQRIASLARGIMRQGLVGSGTMGLCMVGQGRVGWCWVG